MADNKSSRPVISRADARAAGLKRFYLGTPCPHGHVDERKVVNGACLACHRERFAQSYRADPEARRQYLTQWRAENKGRIKGYYDANAEAERQRQRQRHAANPDLAGARMRRWREEKPDLAKTAWAKARAARVRRFVSWADQAEIAKFYASAARLTEETGIPHQVDHVIPLCGKLVSGLHVHNNLQVITAKENAKKGNKMTPEMVA